MGNSVSSLKKNFKRKTVTWSPCGSFDPIIDNTTPSKTTNGSQNPSTDYGEKSSGNGTGGEIPPRLSGDGSSSPRKGSVTEDDGYLRDKDLMHFDNDIKEKTKKGLESLQQGLKSGGLELQALKDVATVLMEVDKEAVTFILNCDLDEWITNTELKNLITGYFENSLEALHFCGLLRKSVERARDDQLIIARAIEYMPENGDPTEEQCQRTIKEFEKFIQAANPFSAEFFNYFNQVSGRQKELQAKLSDKSRRMQRKENSTNTMKKVTTVVLTATCASMVICAAVAMAVAGPALTGGKMSFSEAWALPFDVTRGWLGSLWTNYEKKIEGEKSIIDSAYLGTFLTVNEFSQICAEINNLTGDKDGIIRNMIFGAGGDTIALRLAVGRIKAKQEDYVMKLEDLSKYVNKCVIQINQIRQEVLNRILVTRSEPHHSVSKSME